MTESDLTDVRGIMARIPHRYPFLLIDRITEVVPGERATAIKNVTINEPFFNGHFPGRPIMPGVLIVEAMAQTAGVLCHETVGPSESGRYYLFAGIDKARFRRPVEPGDQLRLEVTITRRIRNMWRFDGKAFVGDANVATATIMCGESA